MRLVRTVTLPTGMTMTLGCAVPTQHPSIDGVAQQNAPPEHVVADDGAPPIIRTRPPTHAG